MRFARKGGIHENKEAKKKKLDATDWSGMFVKRNVDATAVAEEEENNNDDDEVNKLEEQKRKHEKDLNKRIEQENSNSLVEKAMLKYSSLVDKEVLDDLLEMKHKGQLSESEFVEKLTREARSNQRRLTRQNERETSKTCFKCRKQGHSVDECPQVSRDMEQAVGICYKCGSTEHSVAKCKAKVEPGIDLIFKIYTILTCK